MEGLSEAKISDGFRAFMEATVLAQLGDRQQCLDACDAVIESYPQFAPGHMMRLNMLFSLERGDDALKELRGLIAQSSQAEAGATVIRDDRLHVMLAAILVQQGDYDGAKEAMQAAIEAGVKPVELEGVAFMMTRARFGPEWSNAYEFKSKSYVVRSDLSQKVCADATKSLEQALSMYERMFGRGEESDDAPLRYLVYIFSGASGYMSYAGDLFGSAPVNTAGVYTPVLKQLLIWNLPNHEDMMRTVRHEGFHQYLDRIVSNPPLWFNEGTAEYFETATLKRGKMTPGDPLVNHVVQLNSKGMRWAKIEDLVLMSRAEFMADAGLHYAESWALVHYLLHSGRDEKKIYESYRQALIEGATQVGAAESAFAGVDWNALERAVKEHVRELE
ncbi:MAG: tetratricopeptide (TPR) repeat protein [Pseudohongiellaceae bacterium]|jgi:tetratricopeptide (TPR) repeat protein